MASSIIRGSDEMYEFFCKPCSSEKHMEAVGYCQQCSEYLCATCSDYHGKLSATKHHKVIDRSAMPKVNPPPMIRSSDLLTEICRTHPDKVLEYFCKNHNQVCCSVCFTLKHSSCSDKSYIPDVSSGIVNSQEYKTLIEDLDSLVGEIRKRLKKIENEFNDNDYYHSKALASIGEFRKQINEQLDKLEEETKKHVSKYHQENKDAIQSASDKYQILLSNVNSIAADMDGMIKAGKNNQLFLEVKLSGQRMSETQTVMKETDKYRVTRFTFHQDEKVQQMMSTLIAIWSLSVRQTDPPTTARHIRVVNVTSDDDTKWCGIAGIAVLAGGRVIVTDSCNKNVKLIDMKMNKLTSHLSLSSNPYDVKEITQNQVAVTLSIEDKIEMINVTDTLIWSHTINVPGADISRLCYNGSNFVTACPCPASVKIIDMSGRTLNTYTTDGTGKELFKKPCYIAMGRDNTVIYVTDNEANTVTCMTTGGQVVSVYKHVTLKNPRGVTEGKDGTVYVCCGGTCTVHQLTPTGELVRILLGQNEGLATFPNAIVYDDEDDRLYISSASQRPEKRNTIRIYQLN